MNIESKIFCPMCKNQTDSLHKKSHILPNWMHEGCFYDNHKLLKIKLHDEEVEKKQSGEYSSIICSDCETKTSFLDRYASLILTKKSPTSPEFIALKRKTLAVRGEIEAEQWTGINFKLLQNFVFSVLLRAHFAEAKVGINFLGKHFEPILRLYCNKQDSDDQSYPIIMVRSLDTDTMKDVLIMPYKSKIGGNNCIIFRGASHMFYVFTSSHPVSDVMNLCRLQEDGSAYVLVDHFQNTGVFKQAQKTLRRAIVKYPSDHFAPKER